jgi:hypothetical protein
MNSNLLPLSLVAAVGLLVGAETAEATLCTFDVDSSSGIGTGSFTVDLPDSWPPPSQLATRIPASSFRGSYAHGNKWTALAVSLITILEQPYSAELYGSSKKTGFFKTPTRGVDLTPIESVASLPGVTLRSIEVAPDEPACKYGGKSHEKDSLPKGGWHWDKHKRRLISGTFSTDRGIDPAAPVLSESSAAARTATGGTARRPRRQDAVLAG